MIELGSMVRDTITGFTGVATSRHDYMFGCVRYAIEPTELKDGKPVESVIFDEQRIEVLGPPAARPVADPAAAKIGGPRDDPKPRPAPPR